VFLRFSLIHTFIHERNLPRPSIDSVEISLHYVDIAPNQQLCGGLSSEFSKWNIRENTIFWTFVGPGNFRTAPIFGKSIKFALMFSRGIFDNWLHRRRGWLIFLKDGAISYANCFASFENPLLWNIVHLILLACTGVNCSSSTNSNLADFITAWSKKHLEDLASSYHNPFTYIAVSPIFHHGKIS